MKEMIKRITKKEEGFTLVELIVVLVILALLAAILVPTLLGYIDKARDEKNYQTAQTVRVACQSYEDDYYAANGEFANITDLGAKLTLGTQSTIAELAGVDTTSVSAVSVNASDCSNGGISTMTVTIDNVTYTYKDGAWTTSR